jgi:hypothetical protein
VRIIWLALAGVFLTAQAEAQSIAAPRVSENDTWTYQETNENRTGWHQAHVEITVVRAGATSIAISSKPVGSTMPPTEQLTGPDWTRFRSVNGHETVVNKPLSFPLSVGKSWEIEYAEDHPNRQLSSQRTRTSYKVTGWEDVTVPAGTFHALKIEADGQWSAAIAPAIAAGSGTRVDGQGATTVVQTTKITPATTTGRTYKAFWYVPGVKKWVKSIEEYYNPNGVRTERYLGELESYKVSS